MCNTSSAKWVTTNVQSWGLSALKQLEQLITNIHLHYTFLYTSPESFWWQFCKRFSKSLEVKLVFTSEKLRCAFSTKDPYKSEHLSKVVYKFVCASCNASYVGQTCRHLATRIDEHFGKDKKSHIYQHLMSSKDCLGKCSTDCFSVLHTANTKHQLRIK